MSEQLNINKELESSLQLTPEIKQEWDTHPSQYSVTIPDDIKDEVGILLAYLYGLIDILCVKKGFCFMSDEALAVKMETSVRQVKRYIKTLEEKGMIHRNTYNTPRGRKRHIITKSRYKEYWDKFLCHPKVPEKIRKDFLKIAFDAKGQNVPKTETEATQEPNLSLAYTQDKSVPCFIKLDLQERDTPTSPPKPPSIPKPTQNDDERTKVKEELRKAGITGERAEIGTRYYFNNIEDFQSRDNPIAYLIHGIRNGWAIDSDAVQQKSKKNAVKKEEDFVDGQDLCTKFYTEHPSCRGLKYYLGDYALEVTRDNAGYNVPYNDPQINHKLTKLRREHAIYYSRKTHHMEEDRS